ncbi:hypothetical protein CN895_08050 [Bacillus cereus]|uniref:hypothetical protein n=1 Tax=Bacillus cereus TaxID=1396 RepID=UPI000BFD33C9|nr:hypothetical protein [Bacillus cereus]PGK15292.1 hypothetical protein CN895_08050 [Bacillus cereus]
MAENKTKTHNFTIDQDADDDIEETLTDWTKTRRKSQKIRDAIRLLNQVESGQLITIPISAIAQNIPMGIGYNQNQNQAPTPQVPTNIPKHNEEATTVEEISEESGNMEETVIKSKETESTKESKETLSKGELKSLMGRRK